MKLHFREPQTEAELVLVHRFILRSKHVDDQEWAPRTSIGVWEDTYVKKYSLDVIQMVNETGCWVDFSIRHGKPMIVSFSIWLQNLKHDKKELVQKEMRGGR